RPVLLEKPVPAQGLLEAHVVGVEVFVAMEAADHRPPINQRKTP
ncbi:MAG: hypothetical protein JWQ75_2001, partial [Pseudarthrobacter sp.]|nr:hypothetical protein [Pseudarthrobacter sp.]